MGVIRQGILGGVQNKVGSVVGSSWKGIPVIKTLPLSVANPKTAGQITQRTAFALITLIGSVLLGDWVKPFWDRFASKMSGYNSFIKSNVEYCLDGVISDYSLLKMSLGKLTTADSIVIVADDSSNTVVTTPTVGTLNQFSAASDIAKITYYNETQDYWIVSGDLGNRAAAPYSINDTKMVAGDVIHLWIAYKRADLSYVSNSTYGTTTVVA